MTTHPSAPNAIDSSANMLPANTPARVVSRLIDYALITAASAVLLAPMNLIAAISSGPGRLLLDAVSALLSATMCVAYFAVTESRKGQTIGKRLLGLRVANAEGGLPTWNQAWLRNLWTGLGVLGVVPVVGTYAGTLASIAAALVILSTVNGDKDHRRGWHDVWAGGTRVVRTS